MATSNYDGDIVAWVNEQAAFLRTGLFSQLDIEHLTEEIEDVGKSEKRQLASRMAVFLAHLLKCQYPPELQGNSWRRTIKEQRNAIAICIKKRPEPEGRIKRCGLVVRCLVGCRRQGGGRNGLGRLPRILPLDSRYHSRSGVVSFTGGIRN